METIILMMLQSMTTKSPSSVIYSLKQLCICVCNTNIVHDFILHEKKCEKGVA